MATTDRVQDAPLPTGTVTFLLTDIEGSTRLWQAHGASMGAALARHDALLQHAIEVHGGRVFKTAGDAFFAVFPTAPQALLAAVRAQQALHAERWPANTDLHVRIALNTGAAELRAGDYFGTPLNHAARLLSAGHGGQILMSSVTHDLSRDRLPEGTVARSLGEHGLKDLARRETVFQLCHPDLPQAFPPLRTTHGAIDRDAPSIAVLPFADLSRDKDQEYFADGLAEELLNMLSRIRGLRVASRTSAFSFKGTQVDIPTVAQKLNVATVLEGSVRAAGKRVRITAQLIAVASDSHLWSGTYDRELDDIFAVQDDIAQAVVKELRTTLLGDKAEAPTTAELKSEVQAAAKGRSENAEAYRLYLQGRFFEDRITHTDMLKAADYYRQAIALDPHYALAHAALSRTYGQLSGYWSEHGGQEWRLGVEAAKRAVALQPDLAEAHASLGLLRMLFEYDWQGADEALLRALELEPGNAQAARAAAMLASNLGRQDRAVALLRRCVQLDPLNVQAHRSLASALVRAGDLTAAEAAAAKLVELAPESGITHAWLGLVRLLQGRPDVAIASYERESHATFRLMGLAMAHHARGDAQHSDHALHQLITTNAAGGAFQIAEVYGYRGEVDRAFEWLERAYAQRDPGLGMTISSPLLRALHGHAQWRPFVRKMGLPD
jgi:TolB-like protein/class 3 adenylate cyclase/tetratricopeptide (TPR) repeat protein